MQTRLYLAIALILLCIYAFYTRPGPLESVFEIIVSFVILAVGVIAGRGKSAIRITYILVSFAQCRYLIWRINCTLISDTVLNTFISTLFLIADVCCTIFVFSATFNYWHRRPNDQIYDFKIPAPLAEHPLVDVYITTFKEPVDVVRRTISGALSISYANKAIYLLDDGNRPAMKSLADEMKVNYIARENNIDFKAGNLNNALSQTSGEFILSLDADHLCASTIIDYALPELLGDPEIGLLQFAHRSHNPSIIDKTLRYQGFATELASLFYVHLPSVDFWHGVFWVGSGAVLRRKALDDLGGVCAGTVTEDVHTTFRLFDRGWKTFYVPLPQVLALSPETLSALLTQHKRWFTGTIQLVFDQKYWRYKHLSLAHRILQMFIFVCSFSFMPRLLWIASPILFVLLQIYPSRMLPLDFMVAWLPVIYFSVVGNRLACRKNSSPVIIDMLDTVKAPALFMALSAICTRGLYQPFQSTPKGIKYASDWPLSIPYILMLVLVFAAAFTYSVNYVQHPDASFPILIFSWYYVFLLSCSACIALEKPQPIYMNSVPADLPVTISFQDKHFDARLLRVSESGATIACAGLMAIDADEKLQVVFRNNDYQWQESVRLIGSRKIENGVCLVEVSFASGRPNTDHFVNFIRLTVCENKTWQVAPHQHNSTALVPLVATPIRQLASGIRRLVFY